jgi:imidazolonepropionase-like amidohydrolase
MPACQVRSIALSKGMALIAAIAVSYTPYGEARHHWSKDVDGDGDIDATDETLVSIASGSSIHQSGYNVDADVDRNGAVDSNDSRQVGSGSFRAALPAKLHEAGVRFAITCGGAPADVRHLNHMAATAAAFGLPEDEALKSVTLNAAQILGLGDSLGSIERGKSATLIVTNGDPLELTTETLVAYIDGRQIDLSDRQKSLYERY